MYNKDIKIDRVVKNLRSEIYIWYGGLLAMSLICYCLSTSMTKIDADSAVGLQSFLLLLLLTGIPGIFIWFKNKMKSNNLNENLEQRISRYETYSRIRQFVFFVFGFLVLAAHVFTVMKGSIMLLLAVLVLTIFIYPSRTRLIIECGMMPAETPETNGESGLPDNEQPGDLLESEQDHSESENVNGEADLKNKA